MTICCKNFVLKVKNNVYINLSPVPSFNFTVHYVLCVIKLIENRHSRPTINIKTHESASSVFGRCPKTGSTPSGAARRCAVPLATVSRDVTLA